MAKRFPGSGKAASPTAGTYTSFGAKPVIPRFGDAPATPGPAPSTQNATPSIPRMPKVNTIKASGVAGVPNVSKRSRKSVSRFGA